MKRLSANRLARPAVPVSGVTLIAFLAVQVCVNPRSRSACVLLRGLMRSLPIAFGVKPQSGERGTQTRRRLGRGEDWRKSSKVIFRG